MKTPRKIWLHQKEDDQTEKGGDDDLESEKCATRNEYYKLL